MKIYDYNGKRNLCGRRIREARRAQNLSQTELATLMQENGVSIELDGISRIESGERYVADYELRMFARTLHVSIMWLLDYNRSKTQ